MPPQMADSVGVQDERQQRQSAASDPTSLQPPPQTSHQNFEVLKEEWHIPDGNARALIIMRQQLQRELVEIGEEVKITRDRWSGVAKGALLVIIQRTKWKGQIGIRKSRLISRYRVEEMTPEPESGAGAEGEWEGEWESEWESESGAEAGAEAEAGSELETEEEMTTEPKPKARSHSPPRPRPRSHSPLPRSVHSSLMSPPTHSWLPPPPFSPRSVHSSLMSSPLPPPFPSYALQLPPQSYSRPGLVHLDIKLERRRPREPPSPPPVRSGLVKRRRRFEIEHNFKLSEQGHADGPNDSTDLTQLTAAYYSRNWNKFDRGFYEQKSLLGNSVLHIAASHGDRDNWKVAEVAQHAHHLFFYTNSNGDSALHVAARAGHASTIRQLLTSFLAIVKREATKHPGGLVRDFVMMLMVYFTLLRNNQRNTFFHEAFLNGHNTIFKAFQDPFEPVNDDYAGIFDEDHFKGVVNGLVPFMTNKKGESVLYLAILSGHTEAVCRLLDHPYPLQPHGKSPLLAAIRKRDKDMINDILSRKRAWIHLRDEQERYPLHYAASIGYLEGVCALVEKCKDCAIAKDIHGFFPLHLASAVGVVEVVKELLKCYPDPTEILDKDGRNILHIAAKNGKLDVVSYILKEPKLHKLINQKDADGNTPLHLATLGWRPKVVYALTWDTRVDLAAVNDMKQTALDSAEEAVEANPPLRQRLTWCALCAAGTPRSSIEENLRGHQNEKFSYKRGKFFNDDHRIAADGSRIARNVPNAGQYKDRIDTLIVVSTLIITVAFAAGFSVPGGLRDSSGREAGAANLLNRTMFHLFIFSDAISFFGATGVAVILFWARLGDADLLLLAMNWAMPLLGVTLTTLSLAFLSAVYLVIGKLSWLAAIFLVVGGLMALMVLSLFILLWLPMASSNLAIRYISHYPFGLLAWYAELGANGKIGSSAGYVKI